ALLRPIVTLEITQGMARYYADVKEPSERVAYASTTLWFSVGAALVLLAVGLPLGGLLAPLVLGPGTPVAFRLGLVTIAAYILFYTVTNQLVWALRPVAHGVASVAFAAVTAVAAVVWVVGLGAGVAGVFYAQLAGYGVACALALYASRAEYAL